MTRYPRSLLVLRKRLGAGRQAQTTAERKTRLGEHHSESANVPSKSKRINEFRDVIFSAATNVRTAHRVPLDALQLLLPFSSAYPFERLGRSSKRILLNCP